MLSVALRQSNYHLCTGIWAWGKLIHEKRPKKKCRVRVPLIRRHSYTYSTEHTVYAALQIPNYLF